MDHQLRNVRNGQRIAHLLLAARHTRQEASLRTYALASLRPDNLTTQIGLRRLDRKDGIYACREKMSGSGESRSCVGSNAVVIARIASQPTALFQTTCRVTNLN